MVSAGTIAKVKRILTSGERFEVLFTDLGLPDGTGYDVLELIRQYHSVHASRSADLAWKKT